MNNFIRNIQIKKLFNEKDVNWELQKVNVLVGKNGLGKSTILKLINSAVTRKHCDALDLCEEIVLGFDGEKKCIARKSNGISPEFIEMFLTKLSDSDNFSKSIENSIKNNPEAKKLTSTELERVKLDILKKINETAANFSKDDSANENISKYEFKGSVKKMNVELISTVDMNANSVNDITTSSGKKTNFLDMEIDNEVKRLNKNSNKKTLQKKLVSSLNNLFEETNKKTYFIEDEIKIKLNSGRSIEYKDLSSGERQVIFIFLRIINGSVDKSLILMDEPEISLHLSWQEKLLTEITKVNDTSQIIIVTHSPAMVMNGWLDSFIDIKNITEKL